MKKITLTSFLFLLTTPALACECHSSGYSPAGFRGFAGWQLPSQNCIPSHAAMDKGEISYKEKKSLTADKPTTESMEKPVAKDPDSPL